MAGARILSTGYYVPDRVVTNHDLEAMMDTSDAWIQERSGIVERRWVSGEAGSDLALEASRMALARRVRIGVHLGSGARPVVR